MEFKTWRQLKEHAFAKSFREMTEEEFDALKEDVRANGLIEPITLFDRQILDGRNRFRACLELDKEGQLPKGSPTFREFAGSLDEARAEAISKNFMRRHLTKSEKAMFLVLNRMVTPPPKDGSRRQQGTGRDAIMSVGKQYGVNHVTLYKAAYVAAHDRRLAQQVADGKLSVPEAEKLLRKKAFIPVTDIGSGTKFNSAARAVLTELAKVESNLKSLVSSEKVLVKERALGTSDSHIIRGAIDKIREIITRSTPSMSCPECMAVGCAKCKKRGWLPADSL